MDIPGAEIGLISDDLFTLKALPKRVVAALVKAGRRVERVFTDIVFTSLSSG